METKQSSVQTRNENEAEIDLLELFYRLLDHWKLVVVFIILGAAIAWGVTSYFIEPKYSSTAKIYVVRSSDSVVNISDIQLGSYLANDYMQVFQTREVNEQVIMNLDLPYTYEKMVKFLSVSNPSNTRIIEINVTTTDSEMSSKIANEYATVASDYIASVMLTDRPTSLSAAVPAKSPTSPSMVKNVVLGALGGAFIVIVIVIICALLDNKVKSADELTKLVGVPVFAQIPDADFNERAKQQRAKKNSEKVEKEEKKILEQDKAISGGVRK